MTTLEEAAKRIKEFEEAIRCNERLKIAKGIYLGIEAAQADNPNTDPVAIAALRGVADGLAEL